MEEEEYKGDGENEGDIGSEERINHSSCGLSTSNSPTGSIPGSDTTSYNVDIALTSSSLDSGRNSIGESGQSLSAIDPVFPNSTPELLHIVDSAIMGNFESLEKLKKIVRGLERFDDGQDAENISILVIESLFVTMGGVEIFQGYEDKNPPSVMLNSRAAIVSGELIPSLQCAGDDGQNMSPRTRMVKGLLGILRASARNRAMCSTAGLLIVLLRAAEKVFVTDNGSADQGEWNGSPLCQCIQLLGGHSLSVSDLHKWFEVIQNTLTTPWARSLIYSLERAMRGKECRGPACTFEFDGESSGLLSPEEKTWPFNNGYTFATWIYVESFADTTITTAESTTHMPRLFSFLSTDNHGIEAYFHAQYLVVEYSSGKGKKASLHFSHPFEPQRWYFIGLEHTGKQGLLGMSETSLNLYIDGSFNESLPFDFLRISKPLLFCCIGTNHSPITIGSQHRHQQCSLFAEMGPIYIFREPIGSEKMAHLAFRGGDVLPPVSDVVGSAWLTKNHHPKGITEDSVRLDTEIAGCLHLLYHPYLLTGRHCPDASPTSASGVQQKIAKVIGQVHVARRMRPLETLWAMSDGGPMSLLPLLVNNAYDNSLEPKQGDITLATFTLAAPILRIISMASRYHGNNEELLRRRGPEVLSRVLSYLLQSMSFINASNSEGSKDEELVAAIVALCQSEKNNDSLKVQLFRFLLLDLKMWSPCSYGLQKKVLSSLADLVFTEASVMREANAIQILLDGCRKCYWTVREAESIDTFFMNKTKHPVGEVNALVDELLVIIEVLILAAPSILAKDDVCCLLGFMVDCPQPHQVARTLHLLYRLVIQPNSSRSRTFAEAFISSGGVETLLVLLQREAKIGDCEEPDPSLNDDEISTSNDKNEDTNGMGSDNRNEITESVRSSNDQNYDIYGGGMSRMSMSTLGRMSSVSEFHFGKNLGGITLSISAENARNNVYNADRKDGIVVGIINLLGALVSSGHLQFGQHAPTDITNNIFGMLEEDGGSMFDDKLSLALFSLQKAFQAAPNRLMTKSVYTALLTASVNESSVEEDPNFYDCGHRFEHLHLLRVLLNSLPYASTALQMRALQDLLLLACSHPDNRRNLTKMDEWPGWILEILISNYETSGSGKNNSTGLQEVEDFIHNFLIIILEHSMYRKDGWQDIESIIHCVEWLSMVGGSSTGNQRVRREESLPIFKRRMMGGLLDFAARELHEQTQAIAIAAAGAAAGGLPPRDAKAKAENATELLVALVENAIVTLMLVEDHLRLQSKLYCNMRFSSATVSPLLTAFPTGKGEAPDSGVDCNSSTTDTRGLPLDMVDAGGELSPSAAEKLAAASAAEPYDSVNFAFVSYGSCTKDMAEGWNYRSRLWYGVGLPSNTSEFGGGGGGWEAWKLSVEKDSDGNWIELPLIKKCLTMLQVLLLEQSAPGGGLGIGGGTGTGMGSMSSLYQLLDSDQPFLCILRMVLVSLREVDDGKKDILVADKSPAAQRSMLLWSVLSPVLKMPTSEAKRQRVLVTSCLLYSEIYHAVGKDRNPLRKQYLEAILPPFAAILRRWRPLLAGIPELATAECLNPLVIEDRALATDALPIEAALAMMSPGWAAAFASPPASMALAMIAAGAAGGETRPPASTTQLRRDSSLLERKTTKLHTFSSFQQPLEATNKTPAAPKDKARAKAAALAAARDLERYSKIGSGRGLSAVAMATSGKRRSKSDTKRVKRWDLLEAMGTAWTECLQSVDSKSVYGRGFNALSLKFIAVLVGSLALARNMQRSEVDRRTQVDLATRRHLNTGLHEWRKLIYCLIETKRLFSPSSNRFCEPVLWKLDYTESSERMRRCFRRNHYDTGHPPVGQKQGKHNVLDPLQVLKIAEKAISMDVVNDDVYENNASLKGSSNDINQKEEEEDHEERMLLELPSSIVRPSKILKGTFQITSRRINFIIDNLDNNVSADGSDNKDGNKVMDMEKTWSLSCLHQIYRRRYFLRRSALELFMVDHSNVFFDFGSIEGGRNAYRTLVLAHPPNINNIYLETQKPEQLFQRTNLMERWAKREITNFEYLMQLNTLAGRSYNDITQYPVFPWILSDYKSSTLDLSNPSSYRDLSKPIGALNSDRLKEFQERYSSFKDSTIPKYLYASHYSNPRTVLYYLGRVEPFSTLSVKSQGGNNDDADTLFSDVGATWNGVLQDMTDVKELVPELFYLPEMLTDESLANIDSVRLPPWADNSIDFIQKHKMALESDHVSAHLHEWVDLVFGYKQQGKEAISANNVFPCITYEQNIDIDKVSDPVQQQAIQDQIASFGQTPSQLLTVPHIKRMSQAEGTLSQTIFRNPKLVKSHAIPYPEHCNLPAAALRVLADSLVIVDVNGPAAHIAPYKRQPNTPDDQETPFTFQHTKESENIGGTLMWKFKGSPSAGTDEWLFPQASAFHASGTTSSSIISITLDKEIITGGHVDNSIKLISIDGAKTLEIARGHCAPVSCLALSTDDCYLVSGSHDATVLLWRLQKCRTRRIEGPIQVFRGHMGNVTSCSINSDIGVVASCSDSSDVLLHSIRKGRLIRRLSGIEANAVCLSPDGVIMVWEKSPSAISSFTVNGVFIARSFLPLTSCISCMEVSADGNSVLLVLKSSTDNFESNDKLKQGKLANGNGNVIEETSSTSRLEIPFPSICLFDLYTLKMLHSFKLEEGQYITSLALNDDDTNLLVSTTDKQLIAFTDSTLTSKAANK